MVANPYALIASEQTAQDEHMLVQQAANIRHAGELVHQGLAQIAQTHVVASLLSAETLAQVEQCYQEAVQANRMTPFKAAALQHLQLAYLFELLTVVEEAGELMIAMVAYPGG